MLAYVIGAGLLIVALFIVGFILRKRIYGTVDEYDKWKMDILNRNIAEELAKIKGLNLTGETQEKFETWKAQWEYIVTDALPEVEEMLFEAEEAADRYRFSTANKITAGIKKRLEHTERKLTQMLNELNVLLVSEESSRKEVANLKPLVEKLHKHVLGNRRQFDRAQSYFLKELNNIEDEFDAYDELVEAGSYLEANEVIEDASEKLHGLNEQITAHPKVLELSSTELPKELKALEAGMEDMKSGGYYLDHLGFREIIQRDYARLQDAVTELETGTTPEIETMIQEVTDEIQQMYDQLEEEAIARNYIETHIAEYKTMHDQLEKDFAATKDEVDIILKSYYLEDEDMEHYLQMEKNVTKALQELDELIVKIEANETSYVDLRNEMEIGFDQLETLKEQHESFKENIRSLRKDELESLDRLEVNDQAIQEQYRKLRTSNLPGIPKFIWHALDNATKKNERVVKLLQKEPLNMSEVKQALSDSETTATKVIEQINMMIDQAHLTEHVIQYANRYRSREPFLAAKLSEAEQLFRSYNYESSLEQAAQAIEEVEPGALKRIEANYNRINS